MKKKLTFIILLVLFTFKMNYAQEQGNINGINKDIQTNVPASSLYSFDLSDKSIKGSVYIQKSFMPAKLSLSDNKIYNLKYNAYSDEIEIENEGGKPGALNKNIDDLLIVFTLGNKTYEAIDYVDEEGKTSRGYFVHVNNANSKHQLLIKETIQFLDRKPAKNSYDKTKPAQFKRLEDQYYISNGSKAVVEFPKKKKDFPKVFPDKHKDILSFMKKNKIKTSKEEDLVELINYINTL